jgi:hypothetical protein
MKHLTTAKSFDLVIWTGRSNRSNCPKPNISIDGILELLTVAIVRRNAWTKRQEPHALLRWPRRVATVCELIAPLAFLLSGSAPAVLDAQAGRPPAQFKPLDLVSDQGVDSNGIPLNPRWGYQNPLPQSADPRRLCNPLFSSTPAGPSNNVDPSCTSQSPSWDGPGLFGPGGAPPGFGGVWSAVVCSQGPGPNMGHSNWFPATYTGSLYWGEHSSSWGGDDDYSMDLWTPEQRGTLSGNFAGGIHIEFDSDETIDHFRTRWWSDFHRAVDDSDASATRRVYGQTAIVTGLMGIDWAHTPGAELHPVWALAIHDNEGDVNTSEWSFFVRNWGNEGLSGNLLRAADCA